MKNMAEMNFLESIENCKIVALTLLTLRLVYDLYLVKSLILRTGNFRQGKYDVLMKGTEIIMQHNLAET